MAEEIPVTPGVAAGKFTAVEEVLARAVRERVFPGAAFCLGSSSGVRWIAGVGWIDYAARSPARPSTIYDLASLTKVVATTTVVARLVDQGRLSIGARVQDLLPEFRGEGRDGVLLEHLLTHSSGLPAWRPLFREGRTREEVMASVLAAPLESPPGAVERYSDLGAILLGECAARAGRKPLAALSWELVFDPLFLRDTCFCPPASLRRRIAPTEEDREFRKRLIHGEVHDENAFALGGVAGHAGLFSTAEDLGRFAVEILAAVRGVPGPRFLQTETARRFTTRREIVKGSSRALGWDTRSDEEDGTGPKGSRSSSGRRWSPGSFGHTGFTGTSIWFDPARDRFAVLLSNRVHPTRAGDRMLEVRRDFHDAVALALDGGSSRLERAVSDLADAWFIIDQDGRPIGYHRMVARMAPDGAIVASDEMSIAPRSGRLSFRSEVTTGPGLLSPRRARCETRQGSGKTYAAMRGTVEFEKETLSLSADILVDGLGTRLDRPRSHRGTEKRPPGPILFQSLVPLLLASLPDGEDGSGLGELVLAELPAEIDRLIALKHGRRLSIGAAEGGGRRVVVRGGAEESSATVGFGPDGEIRRIEMERFVERRAGPEEVRRAVPGAFGED